MANVLHRITREFIQSANTPDYPVADWIHNPDLSAVTGFDRRYWVVTGDAVTLMDEASRAASCSDSRSHAAGRRSHVHLADDLGI